MKPGFYTMPMEDYLADPADAPSLTASQGSTMLAQSPRHAWLENRRLNSNFKEATASRFDVGSAAHTMLTKSGEGIAVIDAEDWRTKIAKEARAEAYAAGKIPLLANQAAVIDKMVKAAERQISLNPDLGPIFPDLTPEDTMVWQEAGTWCRARPDLSSRSANIIVHYKTTGIAISPNTISAHIARSGWDRTAAHYGAGWKLLTGQEPRQFFVVQEVADPFGLMVVEIDPTFIACGEMRRDRALLLWKRCNASGDWPLWPSQTILAECPEWHERNATDDKDSDQATDEALRAAYDAQKPEGK